MNAIEVNHVWKKYKRGDKLYSLRDVIPSLVKGLFNKDNKKAEPDGLKPDEFWVLRDIHFSVKKGETLGIIGANGAGKSTILKVLSKLLKLNKGNIKVKGRLSALIEITAGFHPDFTGRENIYFNGAIYGMTKKEVDEKYEDIVEFSGVRDFIDTPVKRYSSGMSARLGFAIAAYVNPDILLVDEVLSVGDMTFQAKCVEKMRELLTSGTTVVFISHNISLMASLCQRMILLDHGKILKDGRPDEVIPMYERLVFKSQEDSANQQVQKAKDGSVDINEGAFVDVDKIEMRDEKRTAQKVFGTREKFHISFDLDVKKKLDDFVLHYEVYRSDNVCCCASNTKNDNYTVDCQQGINRFTIDVNDVNLAPGVYYVVISVWDKAMIHPYILKKGAIFTIESRGVLFYTSSIVLPSSTWKKH